VLARPEECDYLHVAKTTLPETIDALSVWNRAMAQPLPGMGLAFWLRDAISARFGVAPIGGFSGLPRDEVRPGARLDFFLVEEALPERLLLTARDRHLDVMTCLTATPCAAGTEVAITSSVITHNRFGKAYMVPVGPAHRLIVALMLRGLRHR